MHFTRRDTVGNIYSLRKHPKNLYDFFGIRFGVNSQTASAYPWHLRCQGSLI